MAFALLRVTGQPQAPQTEPGSVTEEDLVARAQADPRAFAPLYERYLGRVYRYCYSRLGSREAAEDATGEVFMRVLANLDRFRAGVFAAWLYTIARNVVTDYQRRRHPVEPLENADGIPASLAEAPGSEGERAVLLAALAELPDEQRTVLELQFAGWSGDEIAAVLGKSPSATRMIRHRAIQRLQKLLNPTGKA